MRLSAKVVKNYASINNFSFANQWTIRANEANTLYFQLVDLDMTDCTTKQPLRYIPIGCGTSPVVPPSVSVTFPSIDDNDVLTIAATQVDGADGSLWKVDLTALQTPKSGNVIFNVVSECTPRAFGVMNTLVVEYPGDDGSC